MDNKSGRIMSPEEIAVQSICKQLFKSRLFRGYYEQRIYVDSLSSYRDVIVLQRGERDLEKLLLDTKRKLEVLYSRYVPNMWIGVSKGSEGNYKHTPRTGLLNTCVWAEMSDLAFGEYWFNIKSLRFRDQEVILKLKMVRAVDEEPPLVQVRPRRSDISPIGVAESRTKKTIGTEDKVSDEQQSNEQSNEIPIQTPSLEDFIAIVQQWGIEIKATAYNFMANDVNRENIFGALKFLCLLAFSIMSGSLYALRFLGVFVLHFMFELSRFTHAATPIVFKMIDLLNKCVGGVFILITMVWRDLVSNRGGAKRHPTSPPLSYEAKFRSLEYSRTDSLTSQRSLYATHSRADCGDNLQ